jgi:hypothetical protein
MDHPSIHDLLTTRITSFEIEEGKPEGCLREEHPHLQEQSTGIVHQATLQFLGNGHTKHHTIRKKAHACDKDPYWLAAIQVLNYCCCCCMLASMQPNMPLEDCMDMAASMFADSNTDRLAAAV